MTSHKCQCGKCIIYSNVKDTTVECTKCEQVYTVDKDGNLQPQPPIEEFNLDKSDPLKVNSFVDTGKFKLYECRRSEKNRWEGAVIVFAENEEEATRLANENDHMYKSDDIYYIKELKLVEGVVYDDFMR